MGLFPRTTSECSDDIDIRPLEFSDLKRRLNENDEEDHHAQIVESNKSNLFFSTVMGLKRKKGLTMPVPSPSTSPCPSPIKVYNPRVLKLWKNAMQKARTACDPWKNFHLEDTCKVEKAKRHRYHALRKCWVVDEVVVKMDDKPFGHGAMRECYRMKKLSNFARNTHWSNVAHNYVAKRYMNESIPNSTYYDDVRLQMDAKLWGEEFNRHKPPKQVDIFQMAILEMVEREGNPLFHVEHYIEGNYIKYNSNSGFVLSEALRMTPQAFSHFTFERSGHELIVVDIQGVDDLYTDPQIHTALGEDYGDGNLGTRGMALFFHSHTCNSICKSLGLTPFELSPSESCLNSFNHKVGCKTVAKGLEEHVIIPNESERECLRLHSLSSGYLSVEERERIDSIGSIGSDESIDSFDENSPPVVDNEDLTDSMKRNRRYPRIRYDSTSDFGENTETKEMALKNFKEMVSRKSRPSHIMGEYEHQIMLETLNFNSGTEIEHVVLGQIHLDLAKYHELNRFVEENEYYDRDAAMFHLQYAAKCANLDAILAMSQIHMGLPHDILPDIQLEESQRNPSIGFGYLMLAAYCNDRASMIKVAKAFDTGIGLPFQKSVNWKDAVFWYSTVVETVGLDRDGNFDGSLDDPLYQLVARQAELYYEGGHDLERDPNKAGELFTSAAELATEAMKGKLASKYYMKAEEAWAEVEE